MTTSDPWQKDENQIIIQWSGSEKLAPIELAWIERIRGTFTRRRIGATFTYEPINEKAYVESMGALRMNATSLCRIQMTDCVA